MTLNDKENFSIWAGLCFAIVLLLQFVWHRRCHPNVTSGRIVRAVAGTGLGLVLALSSYFHIRFGEGRIADYEEHSFEWFTDTYEVTVMTTLAVYFMLYLALAEQPSFTLVVANAVYVGHGALWTTGNLDDSSLTIAAYNGAGVVLGLVCARAFLCTCYVPAKTTAAAAVVPKACS